MPSVITVECWHHKKKKAHHLIGKASVPLPPSVDDADEEASVKAWHILMDKKNKKECGSIELKVVVVDVSATEVLALHNCRQNETGGTAKAHCAGKAFHPGALQDRLGSVCQRAVCRAWASG